MKQKHTVLYRLSLSQPLQSVSLVWSKGKLELEYQLFLSATFVPARVSCGKPSPASFLWGSIAFILLLFWNLSIKLVSPTTCRLLPHYGYHSPYVVPWGGMPLLVSKDSASTDAQRTSGHPLPHYPILILPPWAGTFLLRRLQNFSCFWAKLKNLDSSKLINIRLSNLIS